MIQVKAKERRYYIYVDPPHDAWFCFSIVPARGAFVSVDLAL
jgi:hypothetical protein